MTEYPVLRPGPPYDANGARLRYGGCICGAVRFTVRDEPTIVGVCHCLECRKATGSVSMPYADWPEEAFTSSGEIRTFVGRGFCATCGSRLFHLSPGKVEIMLGAFDDAPGDLKPAREGWIIRREHWLAPIPGASQHERNP